MTGTIIQNKEENTNKSNNEEPTANEVDESSPSSKCLVDPNDGWLQHTNTDLGLMLECSQATLALEQCDECEYTLEFGEALNDHKTTDHMRELSKACSNCADFFSSITNLNEHNLVKHTPAFSGIATCRECIMKVEGFKDAAMEKKDETTKQLSIKLRKMAAEKKTRTEKIAKLGNTDKEDQPLEVEESNEGIIVGPQI